MKYFACILLFLFTQNLFAQNAADAITGKWMAVPKNNIIVEVYKEHNIYKGKIVWFNDNDDKNRPMNKRLDEKNPDPSLRNRRWIGLDVLREMVYNPKKNRWEEGTIYDAKTGKTWSALAWINKSGVLEVKGFWHFELIGQNLSFKRV